MAVRAEISARIEKVCVAEGQDVSAGDEIALLELGDLDARIRSLGGEMARLKSLIAGGKVSRPGSQGDPADISESTARAEMLRFFEARAAELERERRKYRVVAVRPGSSFVPAFAGAPWSGRGSSPSVHAWT
jgi:multidrug efflux pump subunit AcrA (membrane-fusion protein)